MRLLARPRRTTWSDTGYKENRFPPQALAIVIGLSLQQISNQLSKPVDAASVDCDFGSLERAAVASPVPANSVSPSHFTLPAVSALRPPTSALLP